MKSNIFLVLTDEGSYDTAWTQVQSACATRELAETHVAQIMRWTGKTARIVEMEVES